MLSMNMKSIFFLNVWVIFTPKLQAKALNISVFYRFSLSVIPLTQI